LIQIDGKAYPPEVLNDPNPHLRRSMSLVGPRPQFVAKNGQFRKVVSGYMLRHRVRPRITHL